MTDTLEIDHAILLLEDCACSEGIASNSTAERAANNWIRRLPRVPFRAFVARAHRGGVAPAEVLAELRLFAAAGGDFSTIDGRLDFIDQLMRYKMAKDGKRRWGGKAKAPLKKLGARYPGATIFLVLRDGRDVLASRMRQGSFDVEPEHVAHEWVDALGRFQAFATIHPGVARILKYEDLVREPQVVLSDACRAAGLEFDPRMLSYETTGLTLLAHAHGHLSAARIAEGLNGRTIGSWRTDLTPADVEKFERIAGDHLRRSGYPLS